MSRPSFKVDTRVGVATEAVRQVIGQGGVNLASIRAKMPRGGYIRVESENRASIVGTVPVNRTTYLMGRNGTRLPIMIPPHINKGDRLMWREVHIQGWTTDSVKRAAQRVLAAAKPQLCATFVPDNSTVVPIIIGTRGHVIKAIAAQAGPSCSIFFDRDDGLFVIRASSTREITRARVALKSKHDKILFQVKQKTKVHEPRSGSGLDDTVPRGNAFAVFESDSDDSDDEESVETPRTAPDSIWSSPISIATKLEDAFVRGETFANHPPRGGTPSHRRLSLATEHPDIAAMTTAQIINLTTELPDFPVSDWGSDEE
tara:strand:+ start:1117 stop:2061 length:945 start_codon:yes stop_codon:yes gene_type:complete